MSSPGSALFSQNYSTGVGGANSSTPPTSLTGQSIGQNPFFSNLSSIFSMLANPQLPQMQQNSSPGWYGSGGSVPNWFGPQSGGQEQTTAPMSGMNPSSTAGSAPDIMSILQQLFSMFASSQGGQQQNTNFGSPSF